MPPRPRVETTAAPRPAALPSELVLIRHAESIRNVAKAAAGSEYIDGAGRAQLAGVSDAAMPLSDRGWRQARATGAVLATAPPPDVVFHSGYVRTVETTAGLLEALPSTARARVSVRECVALREREPGYTFEMTAAESRAAFPWLQSYWQTHGPLFARPPGGESHVDVRERVEPALRRILRAHRGGRVWIVTHGGTLRAIRWVLEGWDTRTATDAFAQRAPRNCSLTTYRLVAAGRQLALAAYDRVVWDRAASA